jgi:hypothetical protein
VGQPVVQADIPGLARTGAAVSAASVGFRTAYGSNEGDLTPSATLDDWATGPVLRQAVAAWQVFTKDLADQVRKFGDGLSQSALELQASDQAAADRVGGAGRRPR